MTRRVFAGLAALLAPMTLAATPSGHRSTVWLRLETRGLMAPPSPGGVYATERAFEAALVIEDGWERRDENWIDNAGVEHHRKQWCKLFPDERYSRFAWVERRSVIEEP